MDGLGESAMLPVRRHALCLIILPAVLCFVGCSYRNRAAQQLADAPAVRVGEKSYGMADLERFFNSRLNELHGSATSDEAKSALLDSFVEEKLLLHRAEQLQIKPDVRTIASMRERISAGGVEAGNDSKPDGDFERGLLESLMIQKYLHDFLFKDVSVTTEECEAYYTAHAEEFVSNDIVHVREILVESEAEATKIHSLLKSNRNRNFSELARLYSTAPTAEEGGDLGTFQRGDLPQEFEKAIFPMAPGTVSKIVRSQYGYHIFLMEEKILAHQQKLYEVQEKIREKMRLERQRAALDKELAVLANQIPILVHREKLDFSYVGTRLAARGGTVQ